MGPSRVKIGCKSDQTSRGFETITERLAALSKATSRFARRRRDFRLARAQSADLEVAHPANALRMIGRAVIRDESHFAKIWSDGTLLFSER
jgi:hypothetical protein